MNKTSSNTHEKRRGIYRQWKRVVSAAAVTACNGLGGIAGSFIVRVDEAPRYISAIWISIGYRYSPFYITFPFPFSANKLFTCGHDAEKVVLRKIKLTMKKKKKTRSHIMILGIVAVFTVYFFWANRRQRKIGKFIEGTVRFSIPSLLLLIIMQRPATFAYFYSPT